ncbi:hypothetical protein ABT336_11845 [Micromonospora sp. NPDC000207]|uniref:hypothetical protein n=1 Tax=Micromonospora sp. NPDC000207 TaxID=3154246 RepID=UPI003327C391
MATTTNRPAPLPTSTPTFKPTPTPVPVGAARMQNWHIDPADGDRRKRMPYEVPVDADNHRTAHKRHQCPNTRNANGGGTERCGEHTWLLPGDKAPFCREHGDRLTEVTNGSKTRAVLRELYRLHGHSAAPWVLPAAAATVDGVAALGNLGPLDTAPAVVAGAAGAYYVTKRTLTRRAVKRNRIEQGQRTGKRIRAINRHARRAAAVATETGLWATALTATDITTWPGRIIAAAGMIRWAVGMVRWWDSADARRQTPPTPVEVDTTELPAPAVEELDPVRLRALTTWITLIGCVGGPLAGTELVDYQQLPACEVGANIRTRLPNWSAKVVAKVDGSINMREQRTNLLGRIAAAYKCTYADVSFAADDTDLSIGWLRVQPDNPLAETKLWPGPQVANDWKNGRSRIGRFNDGLDIHYQWWTKQGAAHDLISGCTGSGKSEVVAQLLLASLHSDGLVLDWVGDPQGGQSYGALKGAVDWFARDTSEIKLMLLAALKEMLRRNDELSAADIKTWRPTKAMPLLVITLDEVQSFIDDPIILELVEKLVGMGRKCGIKMRLITQIPAAYNLGGSTYIKEQLKAGQTLIFRAMTDVAGRSAVDGDCPVDPTALPDKWGAHTCAAGATTAGLMFVQGINGRDVYGRADYTGDDMAVWLTDAEGRSTLTPGVFGRDAQRESGVLWGDRKERAAALLAAGRSDADLLAGGKAIELIEMASVNQRPATPPGVPPATPPQPPGQPAGRVSRDVVLEAAAAAADSNGRVTKDQVIAQLARMVEEMAPGTRDKALTDLVADGKLRRVKYGLYEVPTAAAHSQG